ncbi:hypothetical protein [Aliarcobacter butzleri]|nr:hypothetical protein [Aliarcobacter butzleri]
MRYLYIKNDGLFGANVNIYEVYNNGNWYNFGYLIGLLFFTLLF